MSLHLFPVYAGKADMTWFRRAWAKSGKTLDMGKSCIRFRKLDDLPLDVIGETIRRWPAGRLIQLFETVARARRARPAKTARRPAAREKRRVRRPASEAPR